MRTAIFTGLLLIALSIRDAFCKNDDEETANGMISFFGWSTVVFFAMDIIEFINNLK